MLCPTFLSNLQAVRGWSGPRVRQGWRLQRLTALTPFMRGDPNIPTCGLHGDVQEPTRLLYEGSKRPGDLKLYLVAADAVWDSLPHLQRILRDEHLDARAPLAPGRGNALPL